MTLATRRTRAALGLGLWIALAQGAAAEPPRPYAALSPGDHAVLEYGGGGRITLVLDEKTDAGTRWLVVRGDDPSAEIAARMTQDAQGRLTAYLGPDGAVLETYEPHNCERVELICRYTVTDAEGVHEEQRFSQREGGLWTYSILRRGEEGFVGKRLGEVRYGADGILQESAWSDLETAEQASVRRIR